jgi:hypothetical protein
VYHSLAQKSSEERESDGIDAARRIGQEAKLSLDTAGPREQEDGPKNRIKRLYNEPIAKVAELADAPDLGSGG